MSTAERALACGLCQAPITEAVLQGGGAKAVRGSLYCAKCAALYDQALTETLAWRTSLTGGVALTCAHCNATVPVDDVRDEAVLFTRGKLACRRCTKEQLRTILLPRTSGRAPAAGSRSSARVPAPGSGSGRSAAAGVPFARIKGDEEPPSSAIGVVLVVVALVLFLGAVGYAVTHRTKAEAGADPQLAAADKARTAADRALGLATKTHETYEKATATLKEIQELAEQYKGYLESEGKFRSAIERATRSRDGFAPALASRLMEDAAGELKKADHPEEAIAVLDRFPKELAHTMAAGELASARARYEALLTCRRAALQLLALDGVGGFADMDTLMASPDAQACGFAQTTLGQRVDAERRRRRNLAVVNATSIPVGATDLKTAAEHEFLFRLVEAEAQYSQIARANPERADAHLGLARIYLERDRLDLALPYAEQGIRLAPNRADAIQVKAWLTWLSNDKDFHDKAGRALGELKKDWFVRVGRRLSWLYDMGRPLHLGGHVRVFARGQTAEATADTAAEAEATATMAAEALCVAPGMDRIDLLLYGTDEEKKKHVERLETRNLTPEGVLLGCFAVTPNTKDRHSVRLAVAAGIARRAPAAAPEWLVVTLPYAIFARPPAGPIKVKLADLERLDRNQVITRPDAWATGLELSSLVYTDEGRQALAAYVSARKEGASPRARENLEHAHRRLAGR